jgi:hypothetical protein
MSAEFPYATHLDLKYAPLEVVDVPFLINAVRDKWRFQSDVGQGQRLGGAAGVVQGEYHWHQHDDLDEFFMSLRESFSSISRSAPSSWMSARDSSCRKESCTDSRAAAVILMVEERG